MSKTLVYFMKPKRRRGPIKIGCSEVPANRLEALSAWSPWPLELIGAVPGSLQDEQFLHKCFADMHTHREWFKPVPSLVACIAKILAAGTIDAVRNEIAPVGSIRKGGKRKRTDEEKLRHSYNSRIRFCEARMRKSHEAWHAPDDVCSIMSKWSGFRSWSPEQKAYIRVPPTTPTPDGLARLDQYLSDPATHSVVPSWVRRTKDPICIPHVAEAA